MSQTAHAGAVGEENLWLSIAVKIVVERVGRANKNCPLVELDVHSVGYMQTAGEVAPHLEDECAAAVFGNEVQSTLDG